MVVLKKNEEDSEIILLVQDMQLMMYPEKEENIRDTSHSTKNGKFSGNLLILVSVIFSSYS